MHLFYRFGAGMSASAGYVRIAGGADYSECLFGWPTVGAVTTKLADKETRTRHL